MLAQHVTNKAGRCEGSTHEYVRMMGCPAVGVAVQLAAVGSPVTVTGTTPSLLSVAEKPGSCIAVRQSRHGCAAAYAWHLHCFCAMPLGDAGDTSWLTTNVPYTFSVTCSWPTSVMTCAAQGQVAACTPGQPPAPCSPGRAWDGSRAAPHPQVALCQEFGCPTQLEGEAMDSLQGSNAHVSHSA
jgi:hypothetical protein